MKSVIVQTDGETRIEDLGEPLHMYTRPILGGLIEVVKPKRLPRPYVMLVNESGLLYDLDLNAIGCFLYCTEAHGAPIVGNIIIMKEAVINRWGERDIVGLTDEEAETFKNLFDDLIYKMQLEEDDNAEEA